MLLTIVLYMVIFISLVSSWDRHILPRFCIAWLAFFIRWLISSFMLPSALSMTPRCLLEGVILIYPCFSSLILLAMFLLIFFLHPLPCTFSSAKDLSMLVVNPQSTWRSRIGVISAVISARLLKQCISAWSSTNICWWSDIVSDRLLSSSAIVVGGLNSM